MAAASSSNSAHRGRGSYIPLIPCPRLRLDDDAQRLGDSGARRDVLQVQEAWRKYCDLNFFDFVQTVALNLVIFG